MMRQEVGRKQIWQGRLAKKGIAIVKLNWSIGWASAMIQKYATRLHQHSNTRVWNVCFLRMTSDSFLVFLVLQMRHGSGMFPFIVSNRDERIVERFHDGAAAFDRF